MTPQTQRSRPLDGPAPVLMTPTKVCAVDLTPPTPQSVLPTVWHVYPAVHVVTARSGNQNYLLLVRCGHCGGDIHQHRAPLGFVSGKRKAACGLGHYVLHVVGKAAVA